MTNQKPVENNGLLITHIERDVSQRTEQTTASICQQQPEDTSYSVDVAEYNLRDHLEPYPVLGQNKNVIIVFLILLLFMSPNN